LTDEIHVQEYVLIPDTWISSRTGKAQCQYKVTGWGIMFICDVVLWCAGTVKPGFSLD